MLIFALNCGSSSLKSAAIDTGRRARLLEFRMENLAAPDLPGAVDAALSRLRQDSGKPPDAIVHRIVHGGERFLQATQLDDGVLGEIDQLNHLAPLHNPPALAAVRQARNQFPQTPHIAVFDTAYHATLPLHVREYALARDVRRRFGVRRYGFHGINHSHVAQAVAVQVGAAVDGLRIVSCHLGNGASATAIERGRSVETSMGMTPLEGLVMGSRAGDLDPGIAVTLLQSGEFGSLELDALLNRNSGMIGLTGTNDMREIERRAAGGDEDCRLALAVYSHRVRKYIGAYAAVMGGIDAIAFTGGVGENSAAVRHACLQRLEFLGAALDDTKNRGARVGGSLSVCEISASASRVRLLVVRADEELAMALAAAELLEASATSSS